MSQRLASLWSSITKTVIYLRKICTMSRDLPISSPLVVNLADFMYLVTGQCYSVFRSTWLEAAGN